MDRATIHWVLRRSPLFAGLGDAAREQLADLARSTRHPAGDWLFLQGEPADAFYLVSTGLLRVEGSVDGEPPVVLGTLGPGSIVGEMGVLDQQPRSASVRVVEDAVLLRIAREPFLAALASSPELSMALIQALSARVRALDRRVEESASLDVRQRLTRHLLRLVERFGVPEGGAVRIDEPLPQSVLASSIGCGRQAVNRALGELQAAGLVEVRRAGVAVVDLPGLRRAAQADTCVPAGPRRRGT